MGRAPEHVPPALTAPPPHIPEPNKLFSCLWALPVEPCLLPELRRHQGRLESPCLQVICLLVSLVSADNDPLISQHGQCDIHQTQCARHKKRASAGGGAVDRNPTQLVEFLSKVYNPWEDQRQETTFCCSPCQRIFQEASSKGWQVTLCQKPMFLL
ncbi:hypothetical protein H1C71_001588 [Ictidomys tridecemlineatus]|nr:hypothetical protein H1C71_001588 [Ictidomys tridecemlineatus]